MSESQKQPKSRTTLGVGNRSVNSLESAIDLTPPTRTAPALLLSMLVHVVALVALGLLVARAPSGTGQVADRPIGIALAHVMPDRTRYTDPAQSPLEPTEQKSSEEATAAAASSAAAPPSIAPPIDLDGILESVQATPSPISGTGMAGEANLDGDAFGSASASGTTSDSSDATTMVFGVSGSGSRFVYVFDRSDSMNGYGGRPLRAAKRELIRSLESLTDRQQFQLIFYNDKPTPFRMSGIPLQMMAGEDNNKIAASRYVGSIMAYGATEHESALKMALRLGPDVIFFLTDARIPRLSSTQLREIQRRAGQGGTTIHAIEFGSDPAAPSESFLRDLAAMNQGQYRYLDVSTLGQPKP
ncbi:hypothetical protein [Rubripirellula obstinata]|uniref:hypothetical protein n=1 Tax=Rubripirellula obstinata TaxID=406547 RepID=UPI00122D0615|nr:hypothetical protein [Rubripirellula obstinata]